MSDFIKRFGIGSVPVIGILAVAIAISLASVGTVSTIISVLTVGTLVFGNYTVIDETK